MDDPGIDPAILAVLRVLWQAKREDGDNPWSLAKIAKREKLPMSVLRRVLTQLQEAGLAEVRIDEEGRGQAGLTQDGAELAAQVFSDPGSPPQ